ncbi:MAG: energy transducer TonB, partial [Bacteroidales bacterium]
DSENENKEANREEIRKSDELASRYSGPTRIYYNLAGRIHTYLPIPIYKCEGSGKVVLAITVTPSGEVTEAKIITGESTATDQCLFETATRTARLTRFNADAAISRNQTGTLTYLFVAQ